MAFPFIFESNFEQGVTTEWDTESDTGSLLDVPHYSMLAGVGTIGPAAPFRGAYCMRIVCGDTNDHTLIEGDLDIALDVQRWTRFYLYVSPDFTATANDTLNIYELHSAGPVVEGAIGLRVTASTGAVEIGVGETAPTVFASSPLSKGVWHCIELDANLDAGGANDGALNLYLDGAATANATVTGLDQAAVIQGALGTQDTLSTTTGTLLFDEFVFDDARIYPITDRFKNELLLTKSAHAFVGQGRVENVSLLSGAATDNVLSVYDTDSGNTNSAAKVTLELKNAISSDLVDPAGVPVEVVRGCYISLSGTNPRAVVKIGLAPAYGSAGRLRSHGIKRKPLVQNV